MAHRKRKKYRRRKKLLNFKPKQDTIYTLIAIGLFAVAGIIFFSLRDNGSPLEVVRTTIVEYIGWGIILTPIVLISIGLLLLKLKYSLTRPNVTMGLILTSISLISLTKAGRIGADVFGNISSFISSIGAFFLLLLFTIAGLMILFNTSLDKVIVVVIDALDYLKGLFGAGFFSDIKTIFEEKTPAFNNAVPSLKIKGGNDDTDSSGKESQPIPETLEPSLSPAVPQTIPIQPASADSNSSQSMSAIVNTPEIVAKKWNYPPLNLLEDMKTPKANTGNIKENADIIERTLDSFGIKAKVTEVNIGPAVTQYALNIAMGTKLSKITSLSNDLALALSAPTGQIRIEAPIPGRNLVGIEVPNLTLQFVTLKKMLSDKVMHNSKSKLTVALGLNVAGEAMTVDIAKMPHVLIAGTTGAGKSVLLNAWITSILYRTTPAEVRLILIDPKRVELTSYNGMPHLLTAPIVEPKEIITSLRWSVGEMERRYKIFAQVGARNIESYNEQAGYQAMPYIVIIIDELADLMSFAASEVEDSITRIAQMARATGIHLIIATQRPSVDVITGLMKANIPCRISFSVSSSIDSRVILDSVGAEKLLGKGDMLYIPPDQAKPTRIQGVFVSDQEVKHLTAFLRNVETPVEYTDEVVENADKVRSDGVVMQATGSNNDSLFNDALQLVCSADKASASLLQRKLSIGYARAARILDQLHDAGVVGTADGSKPREVLIRNPEQLQETQSTN